MANATDTRYPYRITRGQFSRREGDALPHVDPATGRRIGRRRSRQFVHYSARTPDNPLAHDEVLLTVAEAAHLNRGGRRFVRLLGATVRTPVPQPRSTPESQEQDAAEEDLHKVASQPGRQGDQLQGLLDLVTGARGAQAVKAARDTIFKAGVPELAAVPLPLKKVELIALLTGVMATRGDAAGRTEGTEEDAAAKELARAEAEAEQIAHAR